MADHGPENIWEVTKTDRQQDLEPACNMSAGSYFKFASDIVWQEHLDVLANDKWLLHFNTNR